MAKLILITGGARSGKSNFAEALARQHGLKTAYIATGEPSDAEMADRIVRHRRQRPAEWTTIEVPLDLLAGFDRVETEVRLVLIDCLSLWVANRLTALGDSEQPDWWEQADALERTLKMEFLALTALAKETGRDLIVVSNEVGDGLVPMSAIGRAFRDMLGRLHQTLAREADAVFLVTAGLAIELKRLAQPAERWEQILWSE